MAKKPIPYDGNFERWPVLKNIEQVVRNRWPLIGKISPLQLQFERADALSNWVLDVENFSRRAAMQNYPEWETTKDYWMSTAEEVAALCLHQTIGRTQIRKAAQRYSFFKRAPYFFWLDNQTIAAWFVGNNDIRDASQFAKYNWWRFGAEGSDKNAMEHALKIKARHFWHSYKMLEAHDYSKRYSTYYIENAVNMDSEHCPENIYKLVRSISDNDFCIDYSVSPLQNSEETK